MTNPMELLNAADPIRAAAVFLAAWWAKGAVILALGWLAARLLAGRSAAARHLAWALAILAALAVPAASGLLPALDVPLPEAVLARQATATTPAPAAPHEAPAVTAEPDGPAPAVWPATPAPAAAIEPLAAVGRLDPPLATAHGTPRSLSAAFRGVDWRGVGLSVWLTGVLLLLLRAASGRLARRGVVRAAVPAPADWHALLDQAPASLRVRRSVRLLVSTAAPVPMTWGVLRPVVALPADARSWTLPRLRDAVFHELAHVRRFDVLVQSAAELLCALSWPNPLAWVAHRRLCREAEHACDDRILATGVRASLYAGHLLETARGLRKRRRLLAEATAVAMARPSGLSDRIGAVLDGERTRGPVRPRTTALWVLAALAVALPVAALAPAPPPPPEPPAPPAPPAAPAPPAPPAVPALSVPAPPEAPAPPAPPAAPAASLPAPPAAPAPPAPPLRPASPAPPAAPAPPAPPRMSALSDFAGTVSISNTDEEPSEGYFTHPRYRGQCEPGVLTGRSYGNRVQAEDDHWKITLYHGSCSLEIELEGDVRFTADDRGIARMGRGAELEIEEDAEVDRQLVVTPGPGGEPRYRFRVGGEDRPFDQEARGWLAEVLPEVFRTTGLNAPERVARFLEDGGVPAVLAEIRLMSSDHVQRRYFGELLRQHRPSAGEAVALLRAAGETLGSDHALGELLREVPSDLLDDRRVQEAYVGAAATLGSDHEAGEVLRALLRRGDLQPATLDAVMAITEGIGSDHELGEVLVALLRATPSGRPMPRTLFTAAETIGSDHEHGRVLREVIDRGRLDDATVRAVLESAEGIGSDHELAELLVHLARHVNLDGPLRDRYLETARHVGSRHEKERVLTAVGETPTRGR